MKQLLIFTLISVVNVILQTTKTILTTKGNKWIASVINAVAFGFYTIVMIYTVADFSLGGKIIITMVTNFIGVLISFSILEKFKKDKLWKIETTIPQSLEKQFVDSLKSKHITYNLVECKNNRMIAQLFCYNRKQSQGAKDIINYYELPSCITEINNRF